MPTTKNALLEKIADASLRGNLGFLIGAGFSKAVMFEAGNPNVLSWKELLMSLATRFSVDISNHFNDGTPYPEIASIICKKHSENFGISYKDAISELKEEICNVCSWWPTELIRKKYAGYFDKINPSWIVTTNYDLIIESILLGKSKSVKPNEVFTFDRKYTPVYHIHGCRTDPESIIITQNDYVKMFRPNEYRQARLTTVFMESVTVCIGYGLGDINVLTCIDWVDNVFTEVHKKYDDNIIQIMRKESPSSDIRAGQSGEVIVEYSSIDHFFNELLPIIDMQKRKMENIESGILEIIESFTNAENEYVDKFITNDGYRRELIAKLSKVPEQIFYGFQFYFEKIVARIWSMAKPNGAFDAYHYGIKTIYDLLMIFDLEFMPRHLFYKICDSLDELGPYIGDQPGQGFEAGRFWFSNRLNINAEVLKEIKVYANANNKFNIERLIP